MYNFDDSSLLDFSEKMYTWKSEFKTSVECVGVFDPDTPEFTELCNRLDKLTDYDRFSDLLKYSELLEELLIYWREHAYRNKDSTALD